MQPPGWKKLRQANSRIPRRSRSTSPTGKSAPSFTTGQRGILLCPVGVTGFGVAEFDTIRLPKAKGMTSLIVIEDMVEKNGSCELIIEGMVGGKWKQLYKSTVLRGGDKAVEVDVKFPAGMEQLRLKTTIGGSNDNCDHAVWADAQLLESETSSGTGGL